MTFNIKPQIIIGIDPDVEASGLGIINTTSAAGLTVDYMTLPLPKLVEQLAEAYTYPYPTACPVRIFIEAGSTRATGTSTHTTRSRSPPPRVGRQAETTSSASTYAPCSTTEAYHTPRCSPWSSAGKAKTGR